MSKRNTSTTRRSLIALLAWERPDEVLDALKALPLEPVYRVPFPKAWQAVRERAESRCRACRQIARDLTPSSGHTCRKDMRLAVDLASAAYVAGWAKDDLHGY